jgi:hypothetical protein
MNFDQEIKYYVVDSKTGWFTTPYGLNEDKSLASEFKIAGLRKKFGATAKATKQLEERIRNSQFYLVEVNPNMESLLEIKSNISYDKDDILFCMAEYHYSSKVIKKHISYSEAHGNTKEPIGENSELKKIVLNVVKITGKINK